ncbi:class I SAM-dependent methyltransferase [Sphingomonas gilva]|uniref:Class I SAM-dependent methyltransferase n=1 Tax=Sphingomonas gilva TaxID=2305907 RepID=A0A396RSS3_9SPHN|nr:class I SAM-dependent methyltransferase [Sphingomonas gilva]RHW18432.1 class I SAM-dependent methyltransferase [Sphingomonas gilva]
MRRASALIAIALLAAGAIPVAAGPASAQANHDQDVPFLPTPMPAVEAMLDLAQVGPDDSLVDLGSGDGRIAIAAGRRGARALGIEIDPDLIVRARRNARDAGVAERVIFREQNLFEAPISEASVVTLYLLPDVNLRVRPRLLTELAPGSRVVSHAFDMGDWMPDAHRQVEERNVYLWIVPAIVGGEWRMTLADGGEHLLRIDQRFQRATGTLDGVAIGGPSLRGARFAFTAGGKRYRGVVSETTITPDPAADGEEGWIARRR